MNQQLQELRNSFDQAAACLSRNDPKRAEKIIVKALKTIPNEPNLSRLLGVSLMQQGRFDEAQDRLSQVVRLVPEFVEAHESLAEACLSQGKTEEALKHLKKAVELNPSSETATFRLAEVLAMAGFGPQADEAFERAFRSQSKEKGLLVEGMEAFREQGLCGGREEISLGLAKGPR